MIEMINAIVTSLEKDKLAAMPYGDVELQSLLGRKARYVDKNEKVWPGRVVAIEDPFVIVEFEQFPSSLGQGQILEIENPNGEEAEES